MTKSFINEETINYLINHWNNKKDFSSFSVTERRKYESLISKQIDLHYKKNELKERNILVQLNKNIVKNLPFEFGLNEDVIIKEKRLIKATIKELDPVTRQALVQPNDNVLKEPFYCPESMIMPIKRQEEEQQMRLF